MARNGIFPAVTLILHDKLICFKTYVFQRGVLAIFGCFRVWYVFDFYHSFCASKQTPCTGCIRLGRLKISHLSYYIATGSSSMGASLVAFCLYTCHICSLLLSRDFSRLPCILCNYKNGFRFESSINGIAIANMDIRNCGGECVRLRYFITYAQVCL